MFIVERLFIRIEIDVETSINALTSALGVLDRGHQITVFHDSKYPWLTVDGRIEARGEQQSLFDDALADGGLRETIYITWDDQWAWTTYRHRESGRLGRYFVLHPEPEDGQSPWIKNMGEREEWEAYAEVPGDSDLQKMAAYYQLPGITHRDRLEFPDVWENRRELVVAGKGHKTPTPSIDPNSPLGLMRRASEGNPLSISEAIRLMQAGYGPLSVKVVSGAFLAHCVFAPKRQLFRRRAVLRGPDGQKLVPVLSSLDQIPGVSSDQLEKDFAPILVLDLIKQLERDEGMLFNPLQKNCSLQIDPEDVPSFRKTIESGSVWS